ncbi:aldo/keto reductase [Tessaracoccus sp. MC1865]|uniref:aldo/keto reductase n=1 Tax=Tessaracoccus sp. MC1865 TaxID=2760310 RepID=UPI001603322D|nr:aldo/keto reductase [Tessaracoccus sp. MC1865]MBB1484648.1 aldo/keto reductase [Tessaracoccus sp. MC1865]QTO36403.1 aldo/keto reductase [Tessaracoccus sp. MC1865]
MAAQQRRIGQFSVSPIGLGGMPASFEGAPRDRGIAMVHAALDAGITLIDTADIYAPSWDTMGHNEQLIAEALRAYGGDTSKVVVATKAGITRAEGEKWGRNGSADYLRSRLEASLENLGVSRIDLYYLHRPDRSITYAAEVEAFAQFKREGLVGEVGISNANVEEIAIALEVLGDGGLAAVQNEFSPRFNHTSKQELDYCSARDIAFLPFSPLGGTGGPAAKVGENYPVLAETGEAHGVSPQQALLAWMLALDEHLIPIPGSSRPETIADSAAAMNLTLTGDEVARISHELLARG